MMPASRGVAQSGSALGWGPSGRRFKSCRPDQFDISGRLAKPKLNHKLKHQARALVDCSSGRGFGVVDLFDVILHRDRCTEEKECR